MAVPRRVEPNPNRPKLSEEREARCEAMDEACASTYERMEDAAFQAGHLALLLSEGPGAVPEAELESVTTVVTRVREAGRASEGRRSED